MRGVRSSPAPSVRASRRSLDDACSLTFRGLYRLSPTPDATAAAIPTSPVDCAASRLGMRAPLIDVDFRPALWALDPAVEHHPAEDAAPGFGRRRSMVMTATAGLAKMIDVFDDFTRQPRRSFDLGDKLLSTALRDLDRAAAFRIRRDALSALRLRGGLVVWQQDFSTARSPRSRRAFGVGDVAGERGDRAAAIRGCGTAATASGAEWVSTPTIELATPTPSRAMARR